VKIPKDWLQAATLMLGYAAGFAAMFAGIFCWNAYQVGERSLLKLAEEAGVAGVLLLAFLAAILLVRLLAKSGLAADTGDLYDEDRNSVDPDPEDLSEPKDAAQAEQRLDRLLTGLGRLNRQMTLLLIGLGLVALGYAGTNQGMEGGLNLFGYFWTWPELALISGCLCLLAAVGEPTVREFLRVNRRA
jgi:hypothetical protein